jgi:serine/threonine protein phosphatase PrpC
MDVHSCSLKGFRNQNEDKHNIVLNENKKNRKINNINFLSVFDGHGGKFVSKFLHDNLSNYFLDKRIKYPLSKKYVNKVFNHIQNVLKNKYQNKAYHCGSTCLVVIKFNKDKNKYINVMNTGDSRSILCRNNTAISLTKDHKPHWPEEKRRIEKLNGRIYFDGDDWRINDLSVSRAFGDIDAHPFLTHIPELFRYKIDKNDKFIILACDGLWDVVTNQEAVNFILENCYDHKLEKRVSNKKKVNIAKKLANYAISKGSTDNITIIVSFL